MQFRGKNFPYETRPVLPCCFPPQRIFWDMQNFFTWVYKFFSLNNVHISSPISSVRTRCQWSCLAALAIIHVYALNESQIIECLEGYHGKNCLNRCSVNCKLTNRCDRYTGQCIEGCNPGWIGDTCDFHQGMSHYRTDVLSNMF